VGVDSRGTRARVAAPETLVATADTTGELRRLRIDAASRRYIGKEARKLELNQILGSASEAYREYDLGWPALRTRLAPFSRLRIAQVSGLSRSQVYELVDGTAKPQGATYTLLLQTVEALESAIIAATPALGDAVGNPASVPVSPKQTGPRRNPARPRRGLPAPNRRTLR